MKADKRQQGRTKKINTMNWGKKEKRGKEREKKKGNESRNKRKENRKIKTMNWGKKKEGKRKREKKENENRKQVENKEKQRK